MIVAVEVLSWDDFVGKFCPSELCESLFLPLNAFSDKEELHAGEDVSVHVTCAGKDCGVIRGTISWVRSRSIKLPGKVMPAGVGITLTDESRQRLNSLTSHGEDYFEDLEEETMIGGNYIKIRKDIMERYHKKKKHTDTTATEKRLLPRLRIEVTVDLFVDDNLYHSVSRDISLGGMSIACDEPFDFGSDVLVVFKDEVMKKEFVIKAHVVRHITGKDGSIRGIAVRFEFENIHQRQTLMAFLARQS